MLNGIFEKLSDFPIISEMLRKNFHVVRASVRKTLEFEKSMMNMYATDQVDEWFSGGYNDTHLTQGKKDPAI